MKSWRKHGEAVVMLRRPSKPSERTVRRNGWKSARHCEDRDRADEDERGNACGQAQGFLSKLEREPQFNAHAIAVALTTAYLCRNRE